MHQRLYGVNTTPVEYRITIEPGRRNGWDWIVFRHHLDPSFDEGCSPRILVTKERQSEKSEAMAKKAAESYVDRLIAADKQTIEQAEETARQRYTYTYEG